jgi:hypothetical protein
MPGFVYLVVGGFPWTRPVQHAMAGTPGAIVLAVGTLAGVVVTASPMPALIRNLRSPFTPRWSDQRIREAGRLGVAAISVALGIFLVARLGTVRKGSQPIIITNHVLDAISGATIILGLALMVAAFIWFPPIGLAALEGGGTELVLTITAEFAKTLALGGVVTTMGGVMLDEAANSHPQSSSSGGNTNVSVSNQGAAGASQRTYGQFSEADLRAAAQSPDRHGLTRLGRALQKHSDRAGSAFSGESGGTPASRNEQGLRILDEILNDPNGRTEVLNSVINIWDSAGKGVRFSITGEFMGFLEPLP